MLFGWLNRLRSWWQGPSSLRSQSLDSRLQRIVLTDGVARTLFEGNRDHRSTARGEEEIGWLLLGYRHHDEAVALAALPAGMERDAGAAHVLFHSDVQELASHILRGNDRRLTIIGVVHTHPGSLRQPSDGDLQGDRAWVGQLRGSEGAFAIGTADGHSGPPADHQQCYADLCFSWYALAEGDRQYRTLPVQVTMGPDLAKPLETVWDILETHARPLTRLYRQLTRISAKVTGDVSDPCLVISIALPEPNQQLRLLLNHDMARYYWERDGELVAIDPHEPQVDRAVFLILAELAKMPIESETLVET